MRARIDIGVLVSALIRHQGTTGDVLLALRDGRFTAIYSSDILVKLIDVFGYPDFRQKIYIDLDDISLRPHQFIALAGKTGDTQPQSHCLPQPQR